MVDPFHDVRQEIERLVMSGLRPNPYYFPDLCPALTAEQIIMLYGKDVSGISLGVH